MMKFKNKYETTLLYIADIIKPSFFIVLNHLYLKTCFINENFILVL